MYIPRRKNVAQTTTREWFAAGVERKNKQAKWFILATVRFGFSRCLGTITLASGLPNHKRKKKKTLRINWHKGPVSYFRHSSN